MSSALTPKQWITIVCVNIFVSAITTLIVVRVLINQATSPTVNAAPPAVLASPTAQPTDSVSAAPPTGEPTQATQTSQASQASQAPTAARATTRPNTATVRPSSTTAVTKTPAGSDTSATGTTSQTNQGKVRIGRALFPGQHQRETVVIANDSEQDVVMKGWVLSSSRNISYTFGNVTLFRSNFINLHTTSGTDVPTDLFWNRSEPAWQVGDVLTLSNQGQVVTTYTVK